MSDTEPKEDKKNTNINVPRVVLSELPDIPGPTRQAGRSTGPSLTVDTSLDVRSRSSNDESVYHDFSDNDREGSSNQTLTPVANRSPVSAFFSKLTGGSGASPRSASQSPPPRMRRISHMVPYMNATLDDKDHSTGSRSSQLATSEESFHSARRSRILEGTSPDVINRGLRLALGDNDHSIGGMWLPEPSDPGLNIGFHDYENSSDASYEDAEQVRYDDMDDEDADAPEQEGIKLDDINLNVPSYAEMLAITTSPPQDQHDNISTGNHDVLSHASSRPHVTFDDDVEQSAGLTVPSPFAKRNDPISPGKQISRVFMKFSARVNGRDADDDDEDELMSRSPTTGNSELSSSDEEMDAEYDLEYTRDSMFDHETTVEVEEGSSESNNESHDEISANDKKSAETRTRYSEVYDRNDDVSVATGLTGFESIRDRLENESAAAQDDDTAPKEQSQKKPDLRLFGNSLKLFGPTNKFRLYCSSIVFKSWFEPGITALVFIQAIMLSFEQWDAARTGYVANHRYTFVDWLLFVVNCLHTVELVFKVVTFGFIDDSEMFKELNIQNDRDSIWRDYVKYSYERFKNRKKRREERAKRETHDALLGANADPRFHDVDASGHLIEKRPKPIHSVTLYDAEDKPHSPNVAFTRAFLRNIWNRVDFISCVSFWLSFLLSINQYDLRHHIMIFRSLMCLRILRLTNFTHGTSVILKAMQKATPELLDVALFLGCFWVFFAIIGVQSFKSSLRRQCVWFNPEDSSDYYVNDFQFCGSYLEPGTLNAMPYVYNDGSSATQIKGFRCPEYSKCVSDSNPYGNSVSFDDIANSFELVFVVMSANTFTDLMYYTMDSDTMTASLFYICGIFFLTIWIVNLLVAVIVNAFKITRDEVLSQQKKGKQSYSFFTNPKRRVALKSHVVSSRNLKWFRRIEPLFLLLIISSLVLQCTRNSSTSAKSAQRLYVAESCISLGMLAEILIRIGCFLPKWRLFFYSKQNCFDLFLVVITSVIVIPIVHSKMGRAYEWLTVFQIARWYRVVLSVGYIRNIWFNVLGHVKTIYDLSLFYFIFAFLTSIIMSRFFEGTITKDVLEDSAFAMYNLPNSFISLYAITSTENWTETLYAVQQYAKNKSQQFFGAAYLIVWFMFSNMIILNIFIAVISENLSVPNAQKRKEQIMQYLQQLRKEINSDSEKGILTDFKERVLQSNKQPAERNSREEILYLLLSGKVKGFTDQEISKTLASDDVEVSKNSLWWRAITSVSPAENAINRLLKIYGEFKRNPFFEKEKNDKLNETSDLGNTFRGMIDDDNDLLKRKRQYLDENPNFNTVFYILPPNHKLRRLCQKIVPSSYGDRMDGVDPHKTVSFVFSIMMFCITVAMVIVACYTTPLYRRSHNLTTYTWDWLTNMDLICTLLFSLEFTVKVLADGLIYTPNAYLISSWNIIDLAVLSTLWINLLTTLRGNGSSSSVINGVKAARALRLLTLSSKAKQTFQNTVIAGFWQMMSAATVSMTLLFPFSIWGLNLFTGRLGYCADATSEMADCFGEFTNTVFKWDVVSPNVYLEPPLEFNSFQKSFLSLFEIISLEGWVDLLQNVMNSTGVGTVPSLFASPENGIFVVLFNFISTVFILTLFVSVIIQNYSRNTGRAYRTSEQSSWYEVENILKQVKASKRGNIESYSRFQYFCHRMIVQRNRYWNLFVNFCFIFHTLALLLEVYPSIEGLDMFRYVVYLITSSVFLVQQILIAVARGLKIYFTSKWNWLQTLIIFGAFTTSFISFFVSRETAYANINKLFLVGILLLIIPRIDRLEQLLRYALSSLPSVVSLLYTWGILFLVYAIAMNQIFGLTRIGENTSNNINLRTVTKALILLFRMSFGEGWNYIMNDFTVSSPFCYASSDTYETDCGSKTYAYTLFISWNILSMFIFVNMFVSLIVDSFSYIYHASDPHSYITRNERRKFKESWLKFDPKGTGFIKPQDLPKLLGSLDGVLSYKIYNNGQFSIPELKKKWFTQVDNDPYSVFIDYPAMDSTLSQIDRKKVQIRRIKYERLCEEILMDMRMNHHPGVSFTSVILKVALYAHFEENKCLTLDDFMKRYVSMDKVDTALKEKRIYETLKTVVARWRYKKGQHQQLVDTSRAQAFRNANTIGGLANTAPLIFISEYLKNDEDLALRDRAATLAAIGKSRTFGSFSNLKEKKRNPFAANPFDDYVDDDQDDDDYYTDKAKRDRGLELHFRPKTNTFSGPFNRSESAKEERNLTGSSTALSEAPRILIQPPNPFKSRNDSKDSLYNSAVSSQQGDSELDSLLSVDLSASPKR